MSGSYSAVHITRGDLLVTGNLHISNTKNEIVWDSNDGSLCFKINHQTVLCLTENGIESTGPVLAEIVNSEPLDVNLSAMTITTLEPLKVELSSTLVTFDNVPPFIITVTSPINVSTNLESVDVSNFPAVWPVTSTSPLNVEIPIQSINIANWNPPIEVTFSDTNTNPLNVNLNHGDFDINLPDEYDITTTEPITVSLDSSSVHLSNFDDGGQIIEITFTEPVIITAPQFTSIEITDFPDTFEVTATQPLNVIDNNLTEINITGLPDFFKITSDNAIPVEVDDLTITSWPSTALSVNISSQSIPVPVLTNTSEVVADNQTFDTFVSTFVDYATNNSPYVNQLVSTVNYVYSSNFRSISSTFDDSYKLLYEKIVTVGAIADEHSFTPYGLRFNVNLAQELYHKVRFFIPNEGKTLYIYSINNFDDTNINNDWNIGLENVLGSTINFLINVNATESNQFIITINSVNITSDNFNIDKLDGTGLSGETFTSHFGALSLWILHDSNNCFIFGITDTKSRYIPCHRFSYNEQQPILNKFRPYVKVIRNGISNSICFSRGIEIYNDVINNNNWLNNITPIFYGSGYVNINTFSTTSTNEFYLLNASQYNYNYTSPVSVGNVQFISLNGYCNRNWRLYVCYTNEDFYFSVANTTGPNAINKWPFTETNNTIGSLLTIADATETFTDAYQLDDINLSRVLHIQDFSSETFNINLKEIIDWKNINLGNANEQYNVGGIWLFAKNMSSTSGLIVAGANWMEF